MRPFALFVCLLLSACGNLQNLGLKAKQERQARQLKKLNEAATAEASSRLGDKAVGEVVYVDDEGGYVLVRARTGLPLKESDELECQGTSNARLRVTPERKNAFYAADIVSGTPQKGDAVITVKGKGKAGPKLVPIVANAAAQPGTSAPANTISVDPSTLRPEDLPRSTLDEPGHTAPAPVRAPSRVQPDPGNLLLPPPELPQ